MPTRRFAIDRRLRMRRGRKGSPALGFDQPPDTPPKDLCDLSPHVHMEGRSEVGVRSRPVSIRNGSLSAGSSVVYSWAY